MVESDEFVTLHLQLVANHLSSREHNLSTDGCAVCEPLTLGLNL